ncbi:hypothetical protein MANES_02G221441v8 [Manihot esculenta]|uniref:Uncharacterized protein n=1 Tax=Manihot esculenta TaxID=3983 RepID=A0ACB7IA12_MANES|nr:hypothetical protein MANES_02G221441v8 [Manihot esculenta]
MIHSVFNFCPLSKGEAPTIKSNQKQTSWLDDASCGKGIPSILTWKMRLKTMLTRTFKKLKSYTKMRLQIFKVNNIYVIYKF